MSTNRLDRTVYDALMRAMGKLSHCFSDGDIPYIQYRFVENVFARCVPGALNISRADNSFDVVVKDATVAYGVGVKTFVGPQNFAPTGNHTKTEKVAEFTKDSQRGDFGKLSYEQLIQEVATLRNRRVNSDAIAQGVTLAQSYYHCLVRLPHRMFVHEESYDLIDLPSIVPCDSMGTELPRYQSNTKTSAMVYFKDSRNTYAYNRSKNTLYKTFDLGDLLTGQAIDVMQIADPYALLLQLEQFGTTGPITSISTEAVTEALTQTLASVSPTVVQDPRPYVVLPLFSVSKYDRYGKYFVEKASGLNQWNAGGRARKFGEAYLSIPQWIHRQFPGFFPPRNVTMQLQLPNDRVVTAKVCQQNNKALMSKHNADLMAWLFSMIDGGLEEAQQRFNPLTRAKNRPYTYDDLLAIRKDAVAVLKNNDGTFSIEVMPLGSYETFKAHFENDNATALRFDELLEEVATQTEERT